jgi:hypothetical protein
VTTVPIFSAETWTIKMTAFVFWGPLPIRPHFEHLKLFGGHLSESTAILIAEIKQKKNF